MIALKDTLIYQELLPLYQEYTVEIYSLQHF